MVSREEIIETIKHDEPLLRKRGSKARRVLLMCCALREIVPKLQHEQHGDFVLNALNYYDHLRLASVFASTVKLHPEYFTDKGLDSIALLICRIADDSDRIAERLSNLAEILPSGDCSEISHA